MGMYSQYQIIGLLCALEVSKAFINKTQERQGIKMVWINDQRLFQIRNRWSEIILCRITAGTPQIGRHKVRCKFDSSGKMFASARKILLFQIILRPLVYDIHSIRS